MTTVNILLWRRTVCVLAEETPGTLKRLTGDLFGEDGVFPFVCAVVGKEIYIGSAATSVAYEYPRTKLLALDAILQGPHTETGGANVEAIAAIALFLRALDEAVRRRHFHDVVQYNLYIDDAFGKAQLNVISLACWSAGIATASLTRMTKSQLSIPVLTGEAEVQTTLLGAVQNSVPWIGLGIGSEGQLSPVDYLVAESEIADPLSDCAINQLVNAGYGLPKRMQSPLFLENVASGILAERSLPKSEFGNAVVAYENCYWQTLANVSTKYKERIDSAALNRMIIVESGQRQFAARFEKYGRSALRSATGMTTDCATLESIHWNKARDPNQLDTAIVLSLRGDDGFVLESKLAAPKDAELPFESSHIVYLSKASQLSLCVQLNLVDDLTGDLYDLASIPVRLSNAMKRNTAVHLTVRCLASAVIEIDIEIPEYHFSELLLVDTEGKPVKVAASMARDVRVNYYV